MYYKNWTLLLEHFVCIFCIKIMRIFCLICELAKILLKQTCPLEKQPALHSKHTFCAPEGLIFNLIYANLTVDCLYTLIQPLTHSNVQSIHHKG